MSPQSFPQSGNQYHPLQTSLQSLEQRFLLKPKLLYLVLSMQYFALHSFRGIFAKEKFKIQESEFVFFIGVILLLAFFINLFVAAMNDRFNRPKWLIMGLSLCSLTTFYMFALGDAMPAGARKAYFWAVLFVYLAVNSPVMSVLDKITLEYLAKMPGTGAKTYGKQRLWGTMGFLLVTLVIEGFVKGRNSFMPVYNIQLLVSVAAIAMTALLVKQTGTGERRGGLVRGFSSLLSNFNYMFFILIILLNGVSRAGMTQFITMYFDRFINKKVGGTTGGPTTGFVGFFTAKPIFLCSFCGVVLEILIFLYSEQLTARLGMYWPLMLAQVAALARFVLYYNVDPSAPSLLAKCMGIELLKGVNFGLTHMVGVQLATSMCPVEVRATSQMLYQGAFVGVATCIAGVVFAFVFDVAQLKDPLADNAKKLGEYRRFFKVNSYITLFAVVLFVLKYGLYDNVLGLRREKNVDEAVPEGKNVAV